MNIEDISTICNSLTSVTTDIKWEDHLCFNIGEKMFFITSLENIPTNASFKVSDEDFEELTNKAGFKPAPYLARYKWVYVDDLNRLSKEEWERYIFKSYELISSKFSKKKRVALGIAE
ncbi:conserved protein of unknown function [Tenacibaculum sp. 190130A14a]|uniref:MmcQ/YjbR family DNA-binding protein n=1 Tax=Tenacibaculum polynesiense TaxID=3137857 RepID=A0ABM9P8P6_9FLAO